MWKSVTGRTMPKAAGVGLLLSGIAFLLASPAFAEDFILTDYDYDSYESTNVENTNVEGKTNTNIYKNARTKLDSQYERLIKDSAGNAVDNGACCESSCNSCSDGFGSHQSCLWGDCCLGEPRSLHNEMFGASDSGIHFGGWMQWGYHNEANGLFNIHPNRVNLHQYYLYAEKHADGSNGWDWGFRTDLVYGVDAQDTQAFGNRPGSWDFMNGWDHGIYGFAMPQAYVELANGPLRVIAGHFYTIIGYEVVPATGNFFYSRNFSQVRNQPFTHTGFLASYKVSDNVTAHGGWTAGWDTGFDRFNDGDSSNGSSFLGGVTFNVADNMNLAYATTFGDFGVRGEGYMHSIVLDYAINDTWGYVVEGDLFEGNVNGDHQFAFNNYLFYTINDCLKAGGRLEWWKNSGSSIYAMTAGVNIRPNANLVIRPELRYQWAPNDPAALANGIPLEETILGVDAIVTF